VIVLFAVKYFWLPTDSSFANLQSANSVRLVEPLWVEPLNLGALVDGAAWTGVVWNLPHLRRNKSEHEQGPQNELSERNLRNTHSRRKISFSFNVKHVVNVYRINVRKGSTCISWKGWGTIIENFQDNEAPFSKISSEVFGLEYLSICFLELN
jgi:hypothetical protein